MHRYGKAPKAAGGDLLTPGELRAYIALAKQHAPTVPQELRGACLVPLVCPALRCALARSLLPLCCRFAAAPMRPPKRVFQVNSAVQQQCALC